jgi:hypothetical protein
MGPERLVQRLRRDKLHVTEANSSCSTERLDPANHPIRRAFFMATKLDKTIKRELELDGKAYMVAISPEGVKVTQKGFRKGQELSWRSIISGDASLNEDLNVSADATNPQF